MVRWACDRCGAPCEREPLRVAIQQPGARDYLKDRHLCPACAATLLGWLARAPATPAGGTAAGG